MRPSRLAPCDGRGAGGWSCAGTRVEMASGAEAGAGTGLVASTFPWGLRPPELWSGMRSACRQRVVALGVSGDDVLPPVAGGEAKRDMPKNTQSMALLDHPESERSGPRKSPIGPRWARSPKKRSGRPAAVLQAAAFRVWHIVAAASPGSR